MYNRNEVNRKLIEILRILSEQTEPVGARFIARKLRDRGYPLDERTVRYHLRLLDERGSPETWATMGELSRKRV
ncbi:MAG: hypothetical protein DRO43_01560 [Candidatus Hecatellales archaeon]|nr:MAG: hypothetical protein DRO43_01560 [Candidatus Hecatellales archaeon]